jgi:hypothetical protein
MEKMLKNIGLNTFKKFNLFSEKKMCFFSPESDPYAAYWEDM